MPLPSRPPPKEDKKRRIHWVDLVVLLVLTLGLVFIVYRVESVLHYTWNWDRVLSYIVRYDEETASWHTNLLIHGLLSTIRLAFWGTVLATIIGVVMGLCRTSNRLFARGIARIYVELIRNIPPVVFIFVFYFFISSQMMPLLGIDSFRYADLPGGETWMPWLFGPQSLFSNFLAGLICLAMFEGAYITEIVRAGVQAVEKGQWEAGKAIGLSRWNLYRDVILPQAVQKILPPLAGQFITLIKDSAIVSLISVQELTFLAVEIAATTTRVFETWIITALLYFGLCYSFALLFAWLERRAARSRR